MATRKRRVLLAIGLVAAATGALFAVRNALMLPAAAGLYSRLVAEGGASVQSGVTYGPHARNVLDVYQPAAGDQGGPIVLFIYGGGWRSGERATYGFVGAALASRGITTVVPDYRLFPEVKFPIFIEDAARAYAWTKANLASAPGSSGKRPIIVAGHSAGAYIAAMLALDDRYLAAAGITDRPAGLIGLAGPYSFDPTTYPTTAEIFTTAARADDARSVAQVRQGAPRTLLMHGLKDKTVKLYNTRDLAAALQAGGTPVRKVEFPGIGHIDLLLAISRPLRWRAPVLKEMVKFIRAAAGA
jgi:acetyl esterase/lipase